MNTVFYIFRHDFRLLLRDPTPFAVLFLMPALALFLFTPALGAVLREQGYNSASGIELALPGMAVMFGSLGAAFLGFAIFREHQWQSWQRLIVSGTPLRALLLGKILLPIILVFSQQILLLVLAIIFYDTAIPVSVMAYLSNALAFAINIATLGLVVAAFVRSLPQMNAIIHVASILLAASSGAFIPLSTPATGITWLATFTPSYWLVNAQSKVLLQQQQWLECLPALGILLLQALILLSIAIYRFNGEERKYNWA